MNAIQQPNRLPTLQEIEEVAVALMDAPQVPMPLTHLFAPGIYWREFFVPAGTFVIGHQHKHEHLNVLLKGRMSVLCDGKVLELSAPMVFTSGAGVAKVAIVHEDMRFATIHPLAGLEHCGQDVEKLENEICVKTEAYQQKLAELAAQAQQLQEGRVAA